MKWIIDASVLFPAIYEAHKHHKLARAWLDRAKGQGWGVTVDTFLTVVRLQMNPAAMNQHPSDVNAALEAVDGEITGPCPGAILPSEKPASSFLGRAQGSKQINDFYLVQLAASHGAKLATCDAGIHVEWPGHVELVK